MVLQLKLQQTIDKYAPDYLNYDDPIVSSIVDTSNPYSWHRDGFSVNEWKVISEKADSKINDVSSVNFIEENHMNDLRNRL